MWLPRSHCSYIIDWGHRIQEPGSGSVSGKPVIRQQSRASKHGHSFKFRQAEIAALIGRKPRIFCSAVLSRVASDSVRKEILMSTSTSTTSSASVYTTPAFWERLWRTAGIQSVLCFIVAYIVYGHTPQVGHSAAGTATCAHGSS